MPPSISENNGLEALNGEDLHIYSVGISIGGMAEMRMALQNPSCQIIATTIDLEGAQFTQRHIQEKGLSQQISVKIEDISQPLPYIEGFFDFIYARLVLHYLTKKPLAEALNELYRILKKGGKLFVVVRSSECLKRGAKDVTYDPSTGFTTYASDEGVFCSRYFHTEKSISEYLIAAGFSIANSKCYEEQLYTDFQRTKMSSHADHLIEILAFKEVSL